MVTKERTRWGNSDDRVGNSMVRKPSVLGLETEKKGKNENTQIEAMKCSRKDTHSGIKQSKGTGQALMSSGCDP